MTKNTKPYRVNPKLVKQVAKYIDSQVPGLRISQAKAIEVALNQMLGKQIDIKIFKNKYTIKTK